MFLVHDDLSLKDGAVSSPASQNEGSRWTQRKKEGNPSLLSMAQRNLEYISWVHLAPAGLDQIWTWGEKGEQG